jgi:hypothetical protein
LTIGYFTLLPSRPRLSMETKGERKIKIESKYGDEKFNLTSSSSSSSSSLPKDIGKGWECLGCTYIIKAASEIAHSICPICATPRPFSWTCTSCTFVNYKTKKYACTACGERNRELEATKVARNMDDTWNCPQCTATNSPSANRCRGCNLDETQLIIDPRRSSVTSMSPTFKSDNKCTRCNVRNASIVGLYCTLCWEQKTNESSKELEPKPIVQRNSDDTWSCPRCTLLNEPNWALCKSCGVKVALGPPNLPTTRLPVKTAVTFTRKCRGCKTRDAPNGFCDHCIELSNKMCRDDEKCEKCRTRKALLDGKRCPKCWVNTYEAEPIDKKCERCSARTAMPGKQFCPLCCEKHPEILAKKKCIQCNERTSLPDANICATCCSNENDHLTKIMAICIKCNKNMSMPRKNVCIWCSDTSSSILSRTNVQCQGCHKITSNLNDEKLCPSCEEINRGTIEDVADWKRCKYCHQEPLPGKNECLDCHSDSNKFMEVEMFGEKKTSTSSSSSSLSSTPRTYVFRQLNGEWKCPLCRRLNHQLSSGCPCGLKSEDFSLEPAFKKVESKTAFKVESKNDF